MENQHLERVARIAGIDLPPEVSVASHHVVLAGRRFHYLSWGDPSRLPVLFLHGGNQSAHTWDVICAALSDRHHCVALDQRGHGESEWSYEMEYAPAAQARDIDSFVSHLGWSRFALVGMSMGCLTSLHVAAGGPTRHRLAALVAVDAGPYLDEGGGQQIIDFVSANLTHETFEGFVQAAAKHNPRRSVELLRHSLHHTVRQLADGTWTWKADRRRPISLATMREWVGPLQDLVHQIACPVLIVRGEHSPILSEANANRFAEELPSGRHLTIPDAAHTIQGDNPKALLDAIETFLSQIEGQSVGRPAAQQI